MDKLREKLVELLCKMISPTITVGEQADFLIANGVTVQGDELPTNCKQLWIPASEPPKEPGEYIVAQKHWSDGHLETKKGKWNGVEWLVDGRESLRVAYWMPLPEPPKEG